MRHVPSRAPKILSLLGSGLWIAFAISALAGPTTTSTTISGGTTTTSTTTTTSSTTPTTAPTTTSTTPTTAGSTTTTASTTTTTGVTTTSTTSPTGSTTTTTLLAFEDTRSGDTGDTNTTFFGLDTNAICVAGQVVNYDRLATPFNRSVTFSYESNGTIEKETSQKTVGEFPSTLLVTLTIVNQQSGAAGGPVTEYTGQATADCKLRAELVKAGVRGKLNLSCALGENLSGFSPSLDSSLLQNVQNAFGHGKRARVNTKRGKLTIRHNGDPTDSAPVTCTLNNGG